MKLNTTKIKYNASPVLPNSHEHYYSILRKKMTASGKSINELIAINKLYLRISVTGECNYSCKFCHSEGGPKNGTITPNDNQYLVRLAKDIGFNRVQLTGGEPLLNKQLEKHIEINRKYIDDVGITTNGSLLTDRISSLLSAGLSRMHLSLQREALTSQHSSKWTIPNWLFSVLEKCSDAGVIVRLNIPVEPSEIDSARDFIARSDQINCDMLLFSLLPNSHLKDRQQYINELKAVCQSENKCRGNQAVSHVHAREYFKPSGIRCDYCNAKAFCAESSRSLRVGVDMMLRPCLASRFWDMPISRIDSREKLLMATLFALDFMPL